MKIAVTGAAGWVGGAVVERALEAGHEVVALDRRADTGGPAEIHQVDVTDYDSLSSAIAGCDALVHLAAINGPGRHPDHVVHATNVVGSYNALRAAAEFGITRVCQASSVNAIGGRFSREAHYDYLPLDEEHPTYAEDPYSLSKWICELQADAIARRFPETSIASLRLHGVVEEFADTQRWLEWPGVVERQLWGWTSQSATARAFVSGVETDLGGHEAFYIVAPETMMETPSAELAARHYPDVPMRAPLEGTTGFFDCGKARKLLGWDHDGD